MARVWSVVMLSWAASRTASVVDAFSLPSVVSPTTTRRIADLVTSRQSDASCGTASTTTTGYSVGRLWSSRMDLDVQFGSDNQTAGSVSWGEDLEAEENSLRVRQERVEELLVESDRDFRQTRKAKKWGSFANITKAEDLAPLLEAERAAIAADNARKADLAEAAGVALEVLEPKQAVDDAKNIWEESGNVQISAGSKSWFADMDEDIQAEWEALTTSSPTSAPDVSTTDAPIDTKASTVAAWDVTMDDKTGKMVSRDALAGVRVGSAGGWTLEVFPGDFVVHRKYGIGRFERTCLRAKTKLTATESQARDERRAEILTAELRRRKKVTPDEIQDIRSRFGTDEDMDPISNPQTTVLEITYADAVVHVPVDRAYRLSRYRAGDAVVKPRLSRVKGDAWAKAKRTVEENTVKLAQDVLALYSTRETLQRAPFDPVLEDAVKTFETTFAFEPTPDQKKCFEDAENDMVWRNRPMDRLGTYRTILCIGYDLSACILTQRTL
jgi:transcription-repair coupling factor (superfamily II helicase)